MGKSIHGSRSWDVEKQKELKELQRDLLKKSRQPDRDTYKAIADFCAVMVPFSVAGLDQTHKQALSGKDTLIKKLKKK